MKDVLGVNIKSYMMKKVVLKDEIKRLAKEIQCEEQHKKDWDIKFFKFLHKVTRMKEIKLAFEEKIDFQLMEKHPHWLDHFILTTAGRKSLEQMKLPKSLTFTS